MKTSILFLIVLFAAIACTSKKVDQQEISFYQRLIDDEKSSAHDNLMRMRKWINERGPDQDLSYLIKSENLFAKVDLLLKQNKLPAVKNIIIKELNVFDKDDCVDHRLAIQELKYLDSLFSVNKDSISNLKYRASIYNGLKIVIENTMCRFGTYCGFSRGSEAYYNIQNYKLSDTLEILILPPGLPKGLMRGLVLDKFYKELGIQKADFTNYHLINVETEDTIPIVTKPINDVLLVSTVIHEKGNYLLKGSFTLFMENKSYMNVYTTNELIQIK